MSWRPVHNLGFPRRALQRLHKGKDVPPKADPDHVKNAPSQRNRRHFNDEVAAIAENGKKFW
jgi:hypothetical protein